jgi:hypothetical protein
LQAIGQILSARQRRKPTGTEGYTGNPQRPGAELQPTGERWSNLMPTEGSYP